MAASAPTNRQIHAICRYARQVANGSTMYQGALAGLSGGYMVPLNDAAGIVPFGIAELGGGSGTSQGLDTVVGDGTADNVMTSRLDGGRIDGVAITGLTAATLVGSLVYATDDSTFTLTPGNTLVGMAVGYTSSGIGDLMVFPVPTLLSFMAAGNGIDELDLGYHDWVSAGDGDLVTSKPLYYPGKILAFYAVIDIALTGSGGTITLNLEINTTNVGPTTPTSIVLSTADTPTKGTVVASAAITANNTFVAGDTLSVEISSASATRSTGSYNLYAKVQKGLLA